jgi:predicted Zn-dependent peptidase
MSEKYSVAIGIWIKTGGRYESEEFKGIAHFLEHILFKGTKKFSCRKLKESIEGVGGSLNGFTSEELTCYLVKIPASYANLALDILSDMVLNPLLPYEEVEKERAVILEEIKMYKDLPQSYVHELLDGLLWPGQPLGLTISGTVDSVNRIKREDLVTFKDNQYVLPNIIIAAAGKLNHDRFIKKTESIFSILRQKRKNNFLKAVEQQTRPQSNLLFKDTEQTHLALGFHSLKREHPLKHALNLLHIILGANMSSRMFNEVREKRGLAYEIGTQVKRFCDTGAFVVHAGIDNHKVAKSVTVILKELKKIKESLVSSDEFRRAKDFYLGQLTLALEDTLEHMFWIGESEATLGRLYSLRDIIKEVNKVNRESIREASQVIFREEKINLALIGPVKDSEKEICAQLHIK